MFYLLMALSSLPSVLAVAQETLFSNYDWEFKGLDESLIDFPKVNSEGRCATSLIFGGFAIRATLPVVLYRTVPEGKVLENVRLGIRKELNCFNFIVDRMRLIVRSFKYEKVRRRVYKPLFDREFLVSVNEREGFIREEISTMDKLFKSSILSILDGKHLKIAGNQFPPYVYSKVIDGATKFAGANYEIVQSASAKLNFTYDLDAPVGKPTGSLLPNGTWTGLFGDVFYQKSDLAIVLAHTLDRNGLIDFTTSFGAANLIFSTAFPQVTIKPEAIVYSYDLLVWSMIFLAIVAMIPAVWFHLRVRQVSKGRSCLSRAFMMVYKITLEQCAEIPSGLELLGGLYLLFMIIIGTGYKSNLLASLSFPEAGKIPRNFPELAANTDYEIHFDMNGIAGYNYFMQNESPMIINLRERFAGNLVRNNPAKCAVASFLGPASVCIGWDTVLNQAIRTNLTLNRGLKPVFLTQEAITRTWVTVGLQKNSIYTAAFSYITSSYFETGHITKWHGDVLEDFVLTGIPWMKTQKDTKTFEALQRMQGIAGTKTNHVSALKFRNVYIVFTVFISGVITASFLFAFEMIYLRLKWDRSKKSVNGKLDLWKKAAALGLKQKHVKDLELENMVLKEELRMEEMRKHYIFDLSNYTNYYEPDLSKPGDEFKLLYLQIE